MMDETGKTNYSKNIVIPRVLPEGSEAHFSALRKAKRVIKILSLSAKDVETFSYTIPNGRPGNMELPSLYNFHDFTLKFLPGWGSYSAIIDDTTSFSIRIPQNKKEFEEDMVLLSRFAGKYHTLRWKELKASAVVEFRNELLKSGKMILLSQN